MNQRFDQLAPVQLVVIIGIVHLEVVELQLLLGHFARINVRHLHMLGNVVAFALQIAGVQHAAMMASVVTTVVVSARLLVMWLRRLLMVLLLLLLLVVLGWRWLMALKPKYVY
jgi:hypothetical protein